MMVYVLDRNQFKSQIIEDVEKLTKLKPFTVLPDSATGVYPPVTQWIKGFIDAKFVVTDSFHGVIFSLIFNKQFVAIGNAERGLARFTSILNKVNLSDRLLIDTGSDPKVESIVTTPIDYSTVNSELSKFINHSKGFLKNSLDR